MPEHAEQEAVPAYTRWEWECPACESPNSTEFAPPEDEECDVCGHKVRTDPR